MMILPAPLLRTIEVEAESGYPQEACGLLVGRREEAGCRVCRVEPSANLADEPEHRFEIDPALRFRLMRELRGSDLDIVGHYHSHPDGAAAPSATDLSMAYEPDLTWFIVAVAKGRAREHAAFALSADGGRFLPLPLRISGPD